MADVTIQVAGRAYRLGCGDGEEAHLRALAVLVDAEASRLSRQLSQAPDEARLMLMVALVLADRAQESGQSQAEGDARLAEAEAAAEERARALAAAERQLAELSAESEAAETALAGDMAARLSDVERALEAAKSRAVAAEEARRTAEAEAEAAMAQRDEGAGRIAALEQAVAAALTETAELRQALEEAKAGGLEAGVASPDLFGEADRAQQARVVELTRRIEHLTEQITLHLGAG